MIVGDNAMKKKHKLRFHCPLCNTEFANETNSVSGYDEKTILITICPNCKKIGGYLYKREEVMECVRGY